MKLDTALLEKYATDGFAVIPRLLAAEEVTSFRQHAREVLADAAHGGQAMVKGDKDGRTTLLRLWNRAGDDIYGLLARDERLVSTAEQVLASPTYLYSHKMTMKEPREGGAWEWHQDYGYWYQNRCLAPQMLSIWIALDPSMRVNGCLQVLTGSHTLGRLDHLRVNDQTVVDPEYLAAALDRFPLEYVEMDPGDALVFHCNLLHRSDANTSDVPRWGYIASYNVVDNAPFRDVREYGRYEPLVRVPAGSFMSAG